MFSRKIPYYVHVLLLTFCLAFVSSCKNKSKTSAASADQSAIATSALPMFVIERDIPGAGNLSQQQLKEISTKSVQVLKELGPTIIWDHSYVTSDKVYCVYRAKDTTLLLEHAKKAGIPCSRMSLTSSVINPMTAELEIKE
jgi:hypothetical protein